MTRLPLPALVLLTLLVTGVAVVGAAFVAVGLNPPRPEEPAGPKGPMYDPVERTLPLAVGDRIPPLVAGGWVNGPPPKPDDPGVKLLVVDVWGLWCPHCRSNAPALVRLHEKYADKGVRFVSLTNTMEGGIKVYAQETKTTWPSGYDTPAEVIVGLGAGSGMKTPGYQVAPTIYLVGPDGKVRWSDQRARMEFRGPQGWEKTLDTAIAANIDPPAPAAPPATP